MSNPVVKYYFNEAQNRILVSSSAAANASTASMNALLTSSKETIFDPNYNAKLITKGNNITYTVLNGADDT